MRIATIVLIILPLISTGQVDHKYFYAAPPLGGDYINGYSPLKNTRWTCSTCESFFGAIIYQVRQLNGTRDEISNRMKMFCPLLRIWGRLGIGISMPSSNVCTEVIERLAPTIYFILKNRPQITPAVFCGYTFEQLGCATSHPYLQWSMEIPPKLNSNFSKNKLPRLKTGDGLKKILHLADIHVDLSYQYEAEAFCLNGVLCCHNDSKSNSPPPIMSWFVSAKSKKAGFFGDADRCDAPLRLLELTLRHLVKEHPNLELIYMTGDIVPRNIHEGTQRENIHVIQKVSQLIQKYFPSTPIIPAIGNHETHPVNFFSPPEVPPEINTMWIYNATLEAWKPWIKGEEQHTTFLRGGYYVVDIGGKDSNLKILVLNTNLCYGLNLWGMYKVKDPGHQLKWLIQELDKAERRGQVVHIVGHIPPGRGLCNKAWSRNFYNIVSRYSAIIKGQFYGHTHFDELKLFYDKEGTAMSSLFISPALTPYRRDFSRNPGYKIFYVDGGASGQWDVYDYATFIFDLDEANKTPEREPQWFQLYRATLAYGLRDTTIPNLGTFVEAMSRNQTLFNIYFQHSRKSLPKKGFVTTKETQKKVLCDMVKPYSLHTTQCDRIFGQVDTSKP